MTSKQNPQLIKVRGVLKILILILGLMGCSPDQNRQVTQIPVTISSATNTAPLPTQNPLSTETIPSTVNTQTPFPTFSIIASKEQAGCQKPSDDYSRLEVNGHQLNQRTYEMLTLAQGYYGGEIDMTGDAITQGAYTKAVDASFGTHAGGGAVDLSVMAPGTYTILVTDIDQMISALRRAGFAAWYRDTDALYDGSPPHIHAIAIGDRELSMPAREQLAGPHGYFWGYDGLPVENGLPGRDPHGGPVMCDWMVNMGYPNKTTTPSPGERLP